MIKFQVQKKKVAGQNITPGVIEPSFGIGRIIYSVLEHAFWVRESVCGLFDSSANFLQAEKETDDDKLERAVLSLKPIIAPYKCIVLPLISSDEQFLAKTREIGTSH
jgi:glycyl-tRNA synthetase